MPNQREDLMRYDVVERAPVCIDYRGYQICGMGPPSSGGLAVGQIIGILENFDLTDLSPLDVETVHLFSQAGRLAFADRNRYVADSDFVAVPVEGMLDKDYLANRAALITDMDMGTAEPGEPPGYMEPGASDNTAKMKGTSHVSIVDRYGNALSMTTTIESAFGNGVMVDGFLLNNELTDFSFRFEDANGIPGGRPHHRVYRPVHHERTGFRTGPSGGDQCAALHESEQWHHDRDAHSGGNDELRCGRARRCIKREGA